MAKILGLPFDSYVKKQIEVRQKALARTQKQPEDLVVFNANTSWVRLSSGVKIEPSRATTLASKLEISPNLIQGNALAKNLVLWGGVSSFSTGSENVILDPLKGGVGYGINNAYGFLSNSSQGLKPLPGIQSISCNYKNNGSLKQAQVKMKCFTRSQFEALEAIYLRLGYTVILEWGNTVYYNNKEQFSKVTSYSIPNLLFNNEQDVDPTTLSNKIQENKKTTGGNYDGMVAKVTNFSWNLQDDLSFDITLDLISVGDIIDSLKANIGGTTTTSDLSKAINVSGSIQNLVSILVNKNSSRINTFLYELYDEIYKDALTGWQVSGASQEEIKRANEAAKDIAAGEPKITQDRYLNALAEFRKYYNLFTEGLEIYKRGDYSNYLVVFDWTAKDEADKNRMNQIATEFGIGYNDTIVMFRNGDDEKSEAADKYKGCLDVIENFIKGTKVGEDNFNKLKEIKDAREAIKFALDTRSVPNNAFGTKDNYIRVENTTYEDPGTTTQYIFSRILKVKLGIDPD